MRKAADKARLMFSAAVRGGHQTLMKRGKAGAGSGHERGKKSDLFAVAKLKESEIIKKKARMGSTKNRRNRGKENSSGQEKIK